MTNRAPRAILIAGPTASGKSALALVLAERLGGAVINADSMQVYTDLRILTARPSPAEEARVPHRLYGHVAGREGYSAGRFIEEADAVIREAEAAGQRPVFVGGTGLYFSALLGGLAPVPAISPDVRARWREAAETMGPGALYDLLLDRDPAMAGRVQPTDSQRIVRALEVLEATGRSLCDWQNATSAPVLRPEDTVRLVVSPPRTELHRRCDERFLNMVSGGAIEEVAALNALGLDPALPVMRALGVRPLTKFLAGDLTLDEATALGQTETRQYVKRQETWLRRNMISWNRLKTQETESQVREILTFIDL